MICQSREYKDMMFDDLMNQNPCYCTQYICGITWVLTVLGAQSTEKLQQVLERKRMHAHPWQASQSNFLQKCWSLNLLLMDSFCNTDPS